MRPEVEQELSHTLLIELLAYQFASPVRWIETQDVFLAEKTAERVVEIGPADTLGVMAKRTLASKYEAYDAAKSVQRQILCYNKDAKEIYYDVDPVEEEPEPTPGSSAPAGDAPVSAAAPVAAAAPPPPSAGPAEKIPDEPVQAVDIVRALIAQKLKKPLLEVPLSKAIKDLVGGKYQLQTVHFISILTSNPRQVHPSERDPGRPWQRIRFDAGEARGHSSRRARCLDAGDFRRQPGQAIAVPHCPNDFLKDARWLQHHHSQEVP